MTTCTRCVLEDSSAKLTFDERGVCTFCHYLDSRPKTIPKDPAERAAEFERAVQRMKARRPLGSKYDCVIGLSGGIDSSYAALSAVRAGLRPLAVHVDNGWNTEVAVKNIESIVRGLGVDLITYVIDWEEFRGIQLSLLRAGVVDLELPSDHAIIAGMFHAARRHRIRYVVTGDNDATESMLPEGWNHSKTDLRNIRAINRAYEHATMRTYPHLSTLGLILHQRLLGIEVFGILGYVDYLKERALSELESAVGYRRYGSKHFESIITRFYQGYILPTKFGIDKRRYHYSLLIHSNQMTREEALLDLAKPPYDPKLAEADKVYVCKKFGIRPGEFDELMRQPPRPHADFPSDVPMIQRLSRIARVARTLRKAPRSRSPGPTSGVDGRRYLVMGTGSWPWSHSQEHTFIEPELEHLLKHFERVIVIPQVKDGARRPVPPGVIVRDEFADPPRPKALVRHSRKLRRAASLAIAREAASRGLALKSTMAIRRVLAFGERALHWRGAIEDVLYTERLDPRSTLLYSYWCDEWALGAVLHNNGCAVACRTHGFDLREERHSPPFIPFRAKVLDRIDAVFHVSQAGEDYLRSRYPSAACEMQVSFLGVRDPGFRARPSSDGVHRVVSCSAVITIKRVDLLFLGLRRLAELHPDESFEWTHLGGGPGLDILRALVSQRPANLAVHLPGHLSNVDVLAHYRDKPADLFAHVSSTEGLPVALQEAASCALPIVATAVGGVPEIVSTKNGSLLSPDPDPDEIAQVCWAVLANPDGLAEGSRRIWEERFDAEKNHARFADRLAEVLERKRA